MSAISHHAADAENLKYGFLAAKARVAIEKVLDDSPLTDDDNQVLLRAQQFLHQLADGTQLVTKGSYQGQSSRETVRALRLSLDPIKRLSELTNEREISDFIREMGEKIRQKDGDPDRQSLEMAKEFFRILYMSINSAMNHKRRPRRPIANIGAK